MAIAFVILVESVVLVSVVLVVECIIFFGSIGYPEGAQEAPDLPLDVGVNGTGFAF